MRHELDTAARRTGRRTAITAFLTTTVLGVFVVGFFTNTFSSVVYDRWVKSIFEPAPVDVKPQPSPQSSQLPSSDDKTSVINRDVLEFSLRLGMYIYQDKATITAVAGIELQRVKYSLWAVDGSSLSLVERKSFDYMPPASTRRSEIVVSRPFTRAVACLSFEAEFPMSNQSTVRRKVQKVDFLANEAGPARVFEKYRPSIIEFANSTLCDSMPQVAQQFVR